MADLLCRGRHGPKRLGRMEFLLAFGLLLASGMVMAVLLVGATAARAWIDYFAGQTSVPPSLPAFVGLPVWLAATALFAWVVAYLTIMAMRFRDMGLPGWGPAAFSGFLVGAGGTVIAPWEVGILQAIILAALCNIPSRVFQWGPPD